MRYAAAAIELVLKHEAPAPSLSVPTGHIISRATGIFYHALFDGLELGKQWFEAMDAIYEEIYALAEVDELESMATAAAATTAGRLGDLSASKASERLSSNLSNLSSNLSTLPGNLRDCQAMCFATSRQLPSFDDMNAAAQGQMGQMSQMSRMSRPGSAGNEHASKSQTAGNEHASKSRRPRRRASFKIVFNALSPTLRGLTSRRRLVGYLKRRSAELTTRVLCIVTLLLADSYDPDDYDEVRVGLLDKESILSYTVILIWVRMRR